MRELRVTFLEDGDLVLQAEAGALIQERGVNISSLIRMLNERPVSECMIHKELVSNRPLQKELSKHKPQIY